MKEREWGKEGGGNINLSSATIPNKHFQNEDFEASADLFPAKKCKNIIQDLFVWKWGICLPDERLQWSSALL